MNYLFLERFGKHLHSRKKAGPAGLPITCDYILDITYMKRTPGALRTEMICGRPAIWVAWDYAPDNSNDSPRDLVPAHKTIIRKARCEYHYDGTGHEFVRLTPEDFWELR